MNANQGVDSNTSGYPQRKTALFKLLGKSLAYPAGIQR